MKKILTITGIRPDFIRMSEVFKMLDANFDHYLCHTGQHYDEMLSDVFFKELDIRKPDYNLGIGVPGAKHYGQLAALCVSVPMLLEEIQPDLVLFLGDSNSALIAPVVAKEGYKVGHIEAGMRSYDRRMLEEINRVCCDHVSDFLFVYHEDYKENLLREGIDPEKIHVVGNTIVEVADAMKDRIVDYCDPDHEKQNNQILLDIHRPENFKDPDRMKKIIKYACYCHDTYHTPVKMLMFGQTMEAIDKYGIDMEFKIDCVPLMSYRDYLRAVYDSIFIISDSGTAQEEPALLDTPVIVPRDFTERPQSVEYGCSHMYCLDDPNRDMFADDYIASHYIKSSIDDSWLGDGRTAEKIITILKEKL